MKCNLLSTPSLYLKQIRSSLEVFIVGGDVSCCNHSKTCPSFISLTLRDVGHRSALVWAWMRTRAWGFTSLPAPLPCNSSPRPSLFTHGAPGPLTVHHCQIEQHRNVTHSDDDFDKNTGVHVHQWHHATNAHAHIHAMLTVLQFQT